MAEQSAVLSASVPTCEESRCASDADVHALRKRMFLAFCTAMEEKGIEYVILAGYQGYPDRIDSDVDFMVSDDNFRRLPAFLLDLASTIGARLIQMLQHETSACYYVLASTTGVHIAHLHPDSAASYRRRGRLWLQAEQVLSTRRRASAGFWIPGPATEFEYYFVKRVDKGLVERRHLVQLAALLNEAPQACSAVLERQTPVDLLQSLTDAIKNHDVAWFDAHRLQLQHMLANSDAVEPFGERLVSYAKEWARRIQRVVQPTGLVIAVLGPDGSGKTTVIEHLERELAPAFRRTRRFHLRPHFGAATSGTAVSDPHGQKPRGHLASAAKVLLFLVDYWVGWLRLVYPAKVRSSLIIFDRYYHDMLVDPARYRLPTGHVLPRWLAWLVPQPDLWLVLHAKPEQLVARKGEITLEAARQLTTAYADLARTLGGNPLDTSSGLNETLAEALRLPLEHLAARTRNRLSAHR